MENSELLREIERLLEEKLEAKLEEKLAPLRQRLDSLEGRLEGLENRLEGLEHKVEALDVRLGRQMADLNDQMRVVILRLDRYKEAIDQNYDEATRLRPPFELLEKQLRELRERVEKLETGFRKWLLKD